MKELKGTKTEKNLQEAFAGESQARNKYTYFASKAKKDGFVQIANIFEETAANEKEHAKLWFKYLEGGAIQDTEKNLEAAANGEHDEWIKKTISPKSTQQKITYAAGLKYAKNDGIIFEGSQSEATSKGAYVVLYGN